MFNPQVKSFCSPGGKIVEHGNIMLANKWFTWFATQPEEEEEESNVLQEEEDLNEDDLPRVQNEVDDLQKLFDAAVVDKHSLAMELESMKERLKTATDIIDRLGYNQFIACWFDWRSSTRLFLSTFSKISATKVVSP